MAQKVTGWMDLVSEGGLTNVSTSAEHNVGELAKDDEGNIYRYVLNSSTDSLALADGQVVYLADYDDYIVTRDYTGGSGLNARVVGVAISTVAAGSYGWILVSGLHDAVYTDGSVAAGEALIGHTVDGEADTMAAGEEHLVFGYALTTDTTTGQETCAAYVTCL